MMIGASQRIERPLPEACDAAEPALPHLYLALTECGDRGEGRPLKGTSAAIWQAIDRLHLEGGRDAEIGILELLSIEIHRLGFAQQRPDGQGGLDVRRRVSDLTEQWLGVARLCG